MSDLPNNPKRWPERVEEARRIAADQRLSGFMQSVAERPMSGFAQHAEQMVKKSEAEQR
jgi:hypothetical protein